MTWNTWTGFMHLLSDGPVFSNRAEAQAIAAELLQLRPDPRQAQLRLHAVGCPAELGGHDLANVFLALALADQAAGAVAQFPNVGALGPEPLLFAACFG